MGCIARGEARQGGKTAIEQALHGALLCRSLQDIGERQRTLLQRFPEIELVRPQSAFFGIETPEPQQKLSVITDANRFLDLLLQLFQGARELVNRMGCRYLIVKDPDGFPFNRFAGEDVDGFLT